jgi:signal recognition particle receptor subunit beta
MLRRDPSSRACYTSGAVVLFNYTTMQMTAKIVYYGPGLCGKTTNLQHIHHKTAATSRGEMVSLETETDRTLFFDLLPLDVGIVGGMKVRLQLYTVPGQVFYNATRKLVLKGVDGIVFVADSQKEALEANAESLNNLSANLAEMGLNLTEVPVVFQYNKRDIRNIHTIETLNDALNPMDALSFEAAALHGIGVFETLKGISRLSLRDIRKKLTAEQGHRAGAEGRTAQQTAPAPLPADDAVPGPPPLQGATASEEIPLEFAEEDTGKHAVRPVAIRDQMDIQKRLEELRAMTTGRAARTPSYGGIDRRLQDILLPDRDSRPEVKRKVSLDVPANLLKTSPSLRLHLAFEGDTGEAVIRDAVTVRLSNNKRLDRLTLHLDLELKAKA